MARGRRRQYAKELLGTRAEIRIHIEFVQRRAQCEPLSIEAESPTAGPAPSTKAARSPGKESYIAGIMIIPMASTKAQTAESSRLSQIAMRHPDKEKREPHCKGTDVRGIESRA